MSEQFVAAFKRYWLARAGFIVGIFACSVQAHAFWTESRWIKPPPAPAEIRTVETRIADYAPKQARTFDQRSRRFREHMVYTLDLPEFPGVEFRSPLGAWLDRLKGATARLEMLGDPARSRDVHARWPNVTHVIQVVSIAVNGETLVDLKGDFERSRASKAWYDRAGWICAGLAALGAALWAWRDRKAIAALYEALKA